MAVPYTFGSATASIPLSQLDSNFATTITLGNTAVQLGNTITTLTGVTNVASSGALTLGSNGNTTAIYVDTSQNVGVSTTSPADKLDVTRVSSSNSTGGLSLTNSDASGYGSAVTWRLKLDSVNVVNAGRIYVEAGSATASYMAFQTTVGSTLAERMRIDTSGNVGVGSTSPNLGGLTRALTINTPAAGNYSGYELANAGTLTFRIATNNANAFCGTQTAIPLIFDTNGTERMRIASTGQVLIDRTTNTNNGKLEIYGDSDGSFNPLTVIQGAAGSTSRNSIVFYRVSASATVGTIQTTNTATTYNTSSDYRLKENIAPMTGALAKVAQLKPVTYKWKVDGSDGEGFIAHELAEVCPNAVSGEKDATREQEYEVTPAVKDEEGNITTPAVMGTRTVPEYQGIDTSFLVATLTAAIQELKAINDTQAKTINALTARIVALEAK